MNDRFLESSAPAGVSAACLRSGKADLGTIAHKFVDA